MIFFFSSIVRNEKKNTKDTKKVNPNEVSEKIMQVDQNLSQEVKRVIAEALK